MNPEIRKQRNRQNMAKVRAERAAAGLCHCGLALDDARFATCTPCREIKWVKAGRDLASYTPGKGNSVGSRKAIQRVNELRSKPYVMTPEQHAQAEISGLRAHVRALRDRLTAVESGARRLDWLSEVIDRPMVSL